MLLVFAQKMQCSAWTWKIGLSTESGCSCFIATINEFLGIQNDAWHCHRPGRLGSFYRSWRADESDHMALKKSHFWIIDCIRNAMNALAWKCLLYDTAIHLIFGSTCHKVIAIAGRDAFNAGHRGQGEWASILTSHPGTGLAKQLRHPAKISLELYKVGDEIWGERILGVASMALTCCSPFAPHSLWLMPLRHPIIFIFTVLCF